MLAFELPTGVDRQQVRHSAVTRLAEQGLLSERHVCDPPREAEPAAETQRFVAALAEHLRA